MLRITNSKCWFFLLLGMLADSGHATVVQDEKAWLGINQQFQISQERLWRAYLYSQLRFINHSHPLQTGLIEGGLGYTLRADQMLWLAFRYAVHEITLASNRFEEYRFIQQYTAKSKTPEQNTIGLRMRLEQSKRSNQPEIAWRFRARFGLELSTHAIACRTLPFFYDELFFPVNRTVYLPHKFISENRLFLGVNRYTLKQNWWEIGYLNQVRLPNPGTKRVRLSHVISITYNVN